LVGAISAYEGGTRGDGVLVDLEAALRGCISVWQRSPRASVRRVHDFSSGTPGEFALDVLAAA